MNSITKTCGVTECEKSIYQKGYCSKHYTRLWRYGSPTSLKRLAKGPAHSRKIRMAYNNMKARCSNPNFIEYHRYGGRGISVCDRWLGMYGFSNFLADMGEPPTGLTLDRIDNDGNYEPSNCRWADYFQQAINRGISSTNKSGVKNIYWDSTWNRWIVGMTRKGEEIRIGRFKDFEEAKQALALFKANHQS